MDKTGKVFSPLLFSLNVYAQSCKAPSLYPNKLAELKKLQIYKDVWMEN